MRRETREAIAGLVLTLIEHLPTAVGVATGVGLHVLTHPTGMALSLAIGVCVGIAAGWLTLGELGDEQSALYQGATTVYDRVGDWAGLERCDCPGCSPAPPVEPPF